MDADDQPFAPRAWLCPAMTNGNWRANRQRIVFQDKQLTRGWKGLQWQHSTKAVMFAAHYVAR
jgi:hypothetical protein